MRSDAKLKREVSFCTLKNGIRCASVNLPGDLAFVGMFIKCGMDDETDETLQCAHQSLAWLNNKSQMRSDADRLMTMLLEVVHSTARGV